MKPQITKEFKARFNYLTEVINTKQDGSGLFVLGREFDNSLYPVIKAAIELCEQYKADQTGGKENSVDFMGLGDVEY